MINEAVIVTSGKELYDFLLAKINRELLNKKISETKAFKKLKDIFDEYNNKHQDDVGFIPIEIKHSNVKINTSRCILGASYNAVNKRIIFIFSLPFFSLLVSNDMNQDDLKIYMLDIQRTYEHELIHNVQMSKVDPKSKLNMLANFSKKAQRNSNFRITNYMDIMAYAKDFVFELYNLVGMKKSEILDVIKEIDSRGEALMLARNFSSLLSKLSGYYAYMTYFKDDIKLKKQFIKYAVEYTEKLEENIMSDKFKKIIQETELKSKYMDHLWFLFPDQDNEPSVVALREIKNRFLRNSPVDEGAWQDDDEFTETNSLIEWKKIIKRRRIKEDGKFFKVWVWDRKNKQYFDVDNPVPIHLKSGKYNLIVYIDNKTIKTNKELDLN